MELFDNTIQITFYNKKFLPIIVKRSTPDKVMGNLAKIREQITLLPELRV